jgi:hypothetical protein
VAALRANPQHLSLPEGATQPTSSAEGQTDLANRLQSTTPFASVLVDRLVEERLPNHADAFSRADVARGIDRAVER